MLPRFWLKRLQQLSFFETFKHASTYFSGTLLVHALGVISVPIFTTFLEPDEYGIVNVFTSYLAAFVAVLSLNLHGSSARYFFEKSKMDFSSFMGTIMLSVSTSFIIQGSLIIGFAPTIATWVNLPTHLIKWLVLMSFFVIIINTFSQILIATEKSKQYSTIAVIWQCLKFGLTVVGLLLLTGDLYYNGKEWSSYTFMGKIVGEFIATGVIACYGIWYLRKYISFSGLSWEHLRYGLRFSLPLLPISLSSYLLTSFDQWFINSAVGQSEAGQYAFAYKIAMLYMGFITALMNGANTNYYSLMNNKQYDKVSQQVESMTKLLVLAGCFLIFFAIDVGNLLTTKVNYLDAMPIVPILIGGYIFHGIGNIYNRGIFFVKRNTYLSVIVISIGIINVVLNAYLIPLYDYKVAAYTTLFSYFLMVVFSILITVYVLKLPPLPLGRILKYVVLLGIVLAIYYLLGQPHLGLDPLQIVFKGSLWIVLGMALFYNKIALLWQRDTI